MWHECDALNMLYERRIKLIVRKCMYIADLLTITSSIMQYNQYLNRD